MDWGFFEKNAGENKFLRDQIIYPSKFYYYAASLSNILFRYVWIITVFIQFRTRAAEYADVIGFIFGLVEIFRRFIWNYFRLENEHLNNCGEFRAVRDISIAPISMLVDHATLEEMMDRDTGVRNRRQAKRHDLAVNPPSDRLCRRPMLTTNEASDHETVIINTPAPTYKKGSLPVSDELDTTTTIISSGVEHDDQSPDPVLWSPICYAEWTSC